MAHGCHGCLPLIAADQDADQAAPVGQGCQRLADDRSHRPGRIIDSTSVSRRLRRRQQIAGADGRSVRVGQAPDLSHQGDLGRAVVPVEDDGRPHPSTAGDHTGDRGVVLAPARFDLASSLMMTTVPASRSGSVAVNASA